MSIYKSSPEVILKDIENIFVLAMSKENLSVALKAKELLGREQGLFLTRRTSSKNNVTNLSSLSEEDLINLIQQLELKLNFEHCEKGV
jgi:hypothetical protein